MARQGYSTRATPVRTQYSESFPESYNEMHSLLGRQSGPNTELAMRPTQGTQTPRDVYSKQALEWALEIRNSFPPARGFRSFGGETVTWMSMNNSPGGLRWVIRRLLTNTGEVATPFHSAYSSQGFWGRDEGVSLAINGDPNTVSEPTTSERWRRSWMADRSPPSEEGGGWFQFIQAYKFRSRRDWWALLLVLVVLALASTFVILLLQTEQPVDAGPFYVWHMPGTPTTTNEINPGDTAHTTDMGGPILGTEGLVVVSAADFQYGFGERFPVSFFKGMPFTQSAPTDENRFQPMDVWTSREGDSGADNSTRRHLLDEVIAAGVDARYSGPPCVQLDPDGLVVGDEDCLTLDVVTLTASFALVSALEPEQRKTSPDLKPVIVVIHDGLDTGDIADEQEVNAALSVSTDSVVVSVNFRLGVLGFLPTRMDVAAPTAMTAADDTPTQAAARRRLLQDTPTAVPAAAGATPAAPTAAGEAATPTAAAAPTEALPPGPGTGGLNGVHDIVVALNWVKLYIHNFGGNAAQVTLFGEGTGAMLACILGASPVAANLFSAIAMSSGSCGGGLHTVAPLPRNALLLASFMASMGETDTAALLSAPKADLLAAWKAQRTANPALHTTVLPLYWDDMLLTIDGWVLSEHPLVTYAAGRANMQRVMVGGNSVDTAITQYTSVAIGRTNIDVQPDVSDTIGIPSAKRFFEQRVEMWVDATFAAYPQMPKETIVARILELYPEHALPMANYQASAEMFLRMDSDAMYRCPSLLTAQIMSQAASVFSYIFAAGPYVGDVLLSVDFRSATQEASDGLAGYGTDRRALLGMLCGDECFDLHAAGESERLTLLENAYLRSLQGDGPGGGVDVEGTTYTWQPVGASPQSLADLNTLVFNLPELQTDSQLLFSPTDPDLEDSDAVPSQDERCAYWWSLFETVGALPVIATPVPELADLPVIEVIAPTAPRPPAADVTATPTASEAAPTAPA